jgi:hypothetical protein
MVRPLLISLGILVGCTQDDVNPGKGQVPAGDSGSGGTDGTDGGEGGETGEPCPEGTAWDGSTCVEVDECASDNGGCGDPTLWQCLDEHAAPPTCLFLCAADHAATTAGVATIEQGGSLPSELILVGEATCSLVQDESNRTFVASARYGAGRMIEAGHEGFWDGSWGHGGDSDTFLLNAVRWAGQSETPVVGIEAGYDTAAAFLETSGLSVTRLSSLDAEALATVDVVLLSAYTERDESEVETILQWVETGGGFLMGGHAWWWSYSSNLDPVEGFPGNDLLGPAGILITASTVDAGSDTVPSEPYPDTTHHTRALHLLRRHISDLSPLSFADQVLASGTIRSAVGILPLTWTTWFDKAVLFLDAIEAPVIPTLDSPLIPAEQPIEALVVQLESKLATEEVPERVRVVPAAADFPGTVTEDAIPETRTILVSAAYVGMDSSYIYSGAGSARWIPLGLHAGPGEAVDVQIPEEWANTGIGLQIGPHTDTLWHLDTWNRHPGISRWDAIEAAEQRFANGYGGLLYLTVPAGLDLGIGEVSISGAYPAPTFILGETDPEEWRSSLRTNPGPWAELVGRHFALTVPSEFVAGLDDPTELLELWDAVLAEDAALASIPVDRPRAERITTDRQISAGWMHSGYPIMAHIDSAGDLTNLEQLRSSGDWGAFHELGHNHQWGPAVLPGTTEATVNLWSVRAMEQVIGLDRSLAHPALAATDRAARIQSYIDGGRDFWADWSVWTALETYLMIQEEFGWEPFETLATRYQAQPAGERPNSDDARIQQWVIWSSEAVARDLSPFYEAWGFPLSSTTRAATSAFPPWSDHPLAGL